MSQIFSYLSGTVAPEIKKITPDKGPDVQPDALGLVAIIGGLNILTDGSVPNILSISVAGTTDHAVQIGNVTGSLTSLVLNDTEILLGVTGADPVPTLIQGTANHITLTPGAGTMTWDIGSQVVTGAFTDDGNTAVPIANVINLIGGNNIATYSVGATVTIDVNGTSQHAVQVGGAAGALASLGIGNTGQVLKGNTGADPSWGAVDLTTDVTGFLPVGSGGTGVGTLTDHGVLVGSGVNAITPLAVGTTGQLLVGATGADPAFASSAAGDFAFTNATAATPRVLWVENDDTDPGSSAVMAVSAEPLGGDAYVFFEIDSATQYYSAGIDNSDSDKWKLTNNVDPSSGDAIISTTSAGVITLHNDLDVTEGGTGVSTLTSHGILMGNGAGDIQATAEPSNGQLLIGSTGNFPVLASLTAGVNIAVTPGAGTITIAAAGAASMVWSAVTVDAGLTVNTGTVANKAGLLTMTLPATAALGDLLEITGINTATGWRIAQNANQQIHFGTTSTTAGIAGYIESTATRDSARLVCVVAGANTEWNVLSSIGNITIA